MQALSRLSWLVVFALAFAPALRAQPGQEARLAQEYFQNGEYEKASALFGKLYADNKRNEYFLDRYLDCLIELEQYKEAEKVLREQLKMDPKKVDIYVSYGRLYERQYMPEKAEEMYREAIQKLPADRFYIATLANSFTEAAKYDLAIQTYERGGELLKDPIAFAFQLGDLHRRKGDTKAMVTQYLNSLIQNPQLQSSLQTMFQRFFAEADFEELQAQLYERIQDYPGEIAYPEMLAWLFLQRKDYKNALRQAKALDRKLKENGQRVYALAEIAERDKDHPTAIEAYGYLLEGKDATALFYVEAKSGLLRNKRQMLVAGYGYAAADLRQLEGEYEAFLDEFGRNKITAGVIAELAELEAFYLNDLPKAIALLSDMIEYPRVNPQLQANAKLSLGDFYLMQGDIWEATLLYSQVDKDFAEDLLGQDARFRNARLSYFAGDFEWAQAQCEVLKASTSKLIANDALDLSVFIADNLALDTTARPMMMYAEAELLVFQNRFDEAFAKLDSVRLLFPQHSLLDDILYLEGKVWQQRRDYAQAAAKYERVAGDYPQDIRADNALYALGELYEGPLADPQKAAGYYERILFDYSNSTFAVEARKRYRRLLGEDVQ